MCCNIASVLCFNFWGLEASRTLAFHPVMEPTPHALDSEVLTTGPLGKSHFVTLRKPHLPSDQASGIVPEGLQSLSIFSA